LAGEWTDLARDAPGIGVTHEAARRRQTEGAVAVAVAELLGELTTPSRWERLRGRPAGWRALHSPS
jgi:hypothetical protein